MEYLKDHTSPETAYIVHDYPYGFKLRCQIRYWIEFKKGHGFRFVSQTSNPKRPSLVWNKPKAGIYHNGPMVMTRDPETGYINHSVRRLDSFDTANDAQFHLDAWRPYLPNFYIPELERFIIIKHEYDRLKNTGMHYAQAAVEATRSTIKKG
jgi:hypothetical protein